MELAEFNHFPIDRNLSCYQFLLQSAAMNTCIHISLHSCGYASIEKMSGGENSETKSMPI